MDQKLIDKYFQDQCSEEELEQVLSWFQTDEGQEFLEQHIDEQYEQSMKSSGPFLNPELNSEKLFNRISLNKQIDLRQDKWFMMRVASILIVVGLLSYFLYLGDYVSFKKQSPKTIARTYVTQPDQQKVFTLSEGTRIRLNERSTLTVPAKTSQKMRTVTLKGEAYFEVARDPTHPFVVKTKGAAVKVLGTKFNVKTDTVAGNVQVAVVKGKVALRKKGNGNEVKALLTKNNFGILQLSESQITIEKANVANYLSWINKRLVFNGQSLEQISRQLERLYDLQITFETSRLKNLNLTANFEKSDIRQVLKIISNTLDINFTKNGNHVVWSTENLN